MPFSSLRRTFTAVLLICLFVVSSFAPLANPVTRFPRVKANRSIQETSNALHRESELLVRFRTGVSQGDKNTVIASHGARKKQDLQGESGIEKLELETGRDARTVALQMRNERNLSV